MSADAADSFLALSNGCEAFIKENSLRVHPSNHQEHHSCPPCHTQLTVVACCCFFKPCSGYEEETPISLPSPSSCESEELSLSQRLLRRSDCRVYRLLSSPTAESSCPYCSSEPPICRCCKQRCCTRSKLGKRIVLAARWTLAMLSVKSRPSHHSQSASRTCPEFRGKLPTEPTPDSDTISIPDLHGYNRAEADSGIIWEMPTNGIHQTSRAELLSEKDVPKKPVSALESQFLSTSLSSQSASSELPTPDQYKKDIKVIRNEEDSNPHMGHLSKFEEQGSFSEDAVVDQILPTWKTNVLTRQDVFSESPTSFSHDTELKMVGLQINPSTVTEGAITESSVTTSRQTSFTSYSYSPGTHSDISSEWKSCSGIIKPQTSELQVSSPLDQQDGPFKSKTHDTSPSIYEDLSWQRLSPIGRSSPSDLLEILNSSKKLDGLVPGTILEHMGRVFQSTTKGYLQKLDRLAESEFCAAAELGYRNQPTLDNGLSALKSLVHGEEPNRLNGALSLLSIAPSIVAVLVDEQTRVQFTEALFLDGMEWANAIVPEERNNFRILLPYLLLTGISSIPTHGHRRSSQGWSSSCPTRNPFKRSSLPLEDGRLDNETETGFKLRTGLHAKICMWFVDCECRL